MKKADKRVVRFFLCSIISVAAVCAAVFIWLSVFMSENTEKSIEEMGQIYMAEVCRQIQQKFDSIIDLRMAQVQGIISRTPPEQVQYGEDMLSELRTSTEIRKFTYLGFFTGADTLETVYGDQTIKLASADNFKASLANDGKVLERGFNEAGECILLLGIKAAYPMADGSVSTALVTGVPMEYLDKALYLEQEDSNVYFHIINKNGEYIIRNSNETTDNYFDRIEERFETIKGKTPQMYAEELTEAMEEKRDYTTLISADGEQRHLYCASIYKNSEWYLIAVMFNRVLGESLFKLDNLRFKAMIGSISIIMITMLIIFVQYARLSQNQRNALNKATEEALRASKAKSEFLSSMSHDIRTPMNAIIGMTEIALNNKSDEERLDFCLKNVLLSSKHLLGLINDVLDMSKIESGKMTLNLVPLSLRETTADLVNIIQPQLKAKNLFFDIFVRDIETETVCCDGVRLNQVLLNLLSNAVKFTPEEGRIDIHVYQEPSPSGQEYVRTHFVVEDTGIGISEEFQKKIFDTFTRENSEEVRNTVGTGLGMAITKNIVDLMGGSLELTSSLGHGSKFHVVLDLKKGEEDEDMSLPGWKILVVDDNELLCVSAATNLKELGVQAEWARDGSTALNMIAEHHKNNDDYRFVLIDWRMPHMDGLETIRRIHNQVGKKIPAFLISSYSWSDIESQIKSEEIEGFIPKPLFKSTLYACLSKYAEDKKTAPETTRHHKKVDFTGKRLLVAEDIEINWVVARESLSSFGFDLEHAENGKICVEMFEKSKTGFYDGILMDIRMPVMNGYDATRAIRALDREDKDLPIIAMTADAFSDDVQVCLECGMNAHVAKPLDLRELVRTLQKFLMGADTV